MMAFDKRHEVLMEGVSSVQEEGGGQDGTRRVLV